MAHMVKILAVGLVAGYSIRQRWVWTVIGAGMGFAIGNEFASEALQRTYGMQAELVHCQRNYASLERA